MYERDLAGALVDVVVRRGPRGFTFDDLVRAGSKQQVALSHVADWLADARASGFVDDLGFDDGVGAQSLGPRRYRYARSRLARLHADAGGRRAS